MISSGEEIIAHSDSDDVFRCMGKKPRAWKGRLEWGKVGGNECVAGGDQVVAPGPGKVGWDAHNNGRSCPPRKCVRYNRG